jgi:hypothetical protein
MTLNVIGAGLGRTGTTSLKQALTHLLGGPCFHFLEYGVWPELMPLWLAFDQEIPRYDAVDMSVSVPATRWQSLMPGYIACVDEPASYYWKQLWQAFPDALVILSVRDPVSWCESMKSIGGQLKAEKKQLEGMTAARREFLEFVYALYPEIEEESSRQEDIEFFEEHNGKVIAFAEQNEEFKKRLLVWQIGDGWEPICNALNLPEPDIPFPHSNRRSEYHGY